jgi:hypothetical protein
MIDNQRGERKIIGEVSTREHQREHSKEKNELYCMYPPVQVWKGYEVSGYPTVAAPMWPV